MTVLKTGMSRLQRGPYVPGKPKKAARSNNQSLKNVDRTAHAGFFFWPRNSGSVDNHGLPDFGQGTTSQFYEGQNRVRQRGAPFRSDLPRQLEHRSPGRLSSFAAFCE